MARLWRQRAVDAQEIRLAQQRLLVDQPGARRFRLSQRYVRVVRDVPHLQWGCQPEQLAADAPQPKGTQHLPCQHLAHVRRFAAPVAAAHQPIFGAQPERKCQQEGQDGRGHRPAHATRRNKDADVVGRACVQVDGVVADAPARDAHQPRAVVQRPRPEALAQQDDRVVAGNLLGLYLRAGHVEQRVADAVLLQHGVRFGSDEVAAPGRVDSPPCAT